MKEKGMTLIIDYALAPGKKKTLTFAKDRVAIGRDRTNDVLLANPMCLVSRRHAEIRREGDAYRLVDLGSKNATWLNGRRLEAARACPLRPGDHIQVGDFQIEFRPGD